MEEEFWNADKYLPGRWEAELKRRQHTPEVARRGNGASGGADSSFDLLLPSQFVSPTPHNAVDTSGSRTLLNPETKEIVVSAQFLLSLFNKF